MCRWRGRNCSTERQTPAVDLTASLVSHGHGDQVLALLDQLGALREPALRRVILTLNLPEPALAEALRARAYAFELILSANPAPAGFGANHNRAFARDAVLGPSAAFWVLNPDLRLRGNPLAALVEALARTPAAGAVYPVQLDAAGAPQDSERLLPTPRRLLARYLGRRRQEIAPGQAPDWVNAACLLLRSEAFAQLGGFDERYHMYCEDVDLCLRLRLAGWTLQRADDAVVEHAGHRASHRDPRHLAWHVGSLLRLWRSGAWRDFAGRARP